MIRRDWYAVALGFFVLGGMLVPIPGAASPVTCSPPSGPANPKLTISSPSATPTTKVEESSSQDLYGLTNFVITATSLVVFDTISATCTFDEGPVVPEGSKAKLRAFLQGTFKGDASPLLPTIAVSAFFKDQHATADVEIFPSSLPPDRTVSFDKSSDPVLIEGPLKPPYTIVVLLSLTLNPQNVVTLPGSADGALAYPLRVGADVPKMLFSLDLVDDDHVLGRADQGSSMPIGRGLLSIAGLALVVFAQLCLGRRLRSRRRVRHSN